MHLTHAVRHSGVKEDPLRGGGFSGVNMGHKPDIPHPFQRGGSRQNLLPTYQR
jgi:hypothetical protein